MYSIPAPIPALLHLPLVPNMNSVKTSPLDWLSFPPTSPGDVHAPHPDLFDLELDSSIVTLPQSDQEQLQLLNIELSDPYAFLRSETPRCGPPSTFTVSSESTYGDSYSSHSESVYNYSDFDGNTTDYSLDLGIDFSKFSVDVDAAAAEAKEQLEAAAAAATRIKEENDNGTTGLSNLDSEASLIGSNMFTVPYPTEVAHHTSFHEDLRAAAAAAIAANAAQSATDYYPSAVYNHKPLAAGQSTISPNNLVPLVVPAAIRAMEHASVSPVPSSNSAGMVEEQRDPRKKYKCPSCPRGTATLFISFCILLIFALAFARAYNLKTHQQTHDPNRLKPHTCPHKSCGRSFSRKHDLGRHLVSIHRDEVSLDGAIGVTQGARGWCDDCGAGWVGKQGGCACHDVK